MTAYVMSTTKIAQVIKTGMGVISPSSDKRGSSVGGINKINGVRANHVTNAILCFEGSTRTGISGSENQYSNPL